MDQDETGAATPHSKLLRCDPFDGYPSLTNGKSDAQIICVDPALAAHPNLTLLKNAYVDKLLTDPAGREVTGRRDRHRRPAPRDSRRHRRGRLRRAVLGAAPAALGQ